MAKSKTTKKGSGNRSKGPTGRAKPLAHSPGFTGKGRRYCGGGKLKTS